MILAARTGAPTAVVGDRALHSRFDPRKEAERYLASRAAAIPKHPRVLVILGVGLGYLVEAVRVRWPSARVLGVRLLRGLEPHVVAEADVTAYPDTVDPSAFFLSNLDEADIAALAVLRWEPECRLRPELAASTEEAIRTATRQLVASSMTSGFFGRRWAHNAFANYLRLEELLASFSAFDLVVVAASGPGLELSLQACVHDLRRASVWAVPSSLQCLAHYGIEPDLIVVTDPGWYTVHHLRAATRNVPVAMPLTAAPAANRRAANGRMLLLDQSSFVEQEIYARSPLSRISVPANGTVSGTALLLANKLGVRRLVFLGLDMASFDLRSHCRPHGFDDLVAAATSRLAPLEGVLHARVGGERLAGSRWRVDRSLSTYADWFRRNSASPPIVYRVSDSPVDLSMERLSAADLASLLHSARPSTLTLGASATVSESERRRVLDEVVESWTRVLVELKSAGSAVSEVVSANRRLFSRVAMPELLRFERSSGSESAELIGAFDSFVSDMGKFLEPPAV